MVTGDVNLDGVLDANDIDDYKDYIIGENTMKFNKCMGDLNEDNRLDVADIVQLINLMKWMERELTETGPAELPR